jgi:hypothetical protein
VKDNERIYALYAQANPVLDPDRLPLTLDEVELRLLEGSPSMITQEAVETTAVPGPSVRRRLAAALGGAAIIIAIVIAGVFVSRGDTRIASPDEVVTQVIDAWNDRDLDALADLYDPEILYIYDATAAGAAWANQTNSGLDNVLASFEETWRTYNPTVTWYEVQGIEGRTVTTAETHTFHGSDYRHTVTYKLSEDGLILRQDHVVKPTP